MNQRAHVTKLMKGVWIRGCVWAIYWCFRTDWCIGVLSHWSCTVSVLVVLEVSF